LRALLVSLVLERLVPFVLPVLVLVLLAPLVLERLVRLTLPVLALLARRVPWGVVVLPTMCV
tara:strand:- start:154 stop:339 length:186 start_codon:yes stop_codon:yes gene_type:complete